MGEESLSCVTLGTPMWTCAHRKGNVEIQIWQIGSISNDCSEGRERACGCERNRDREEREREREREGNVFKCLHF